MTCIVTMQTEIATCEHITRKLLNHQLKRYTLITWLLLFVQNPKGSALKNRIIHTVLFLKRLVRRTKKIYSFVGNKIFSIIKIS